MLTHVYTYCAGCPLARVRCGLVDSTDAAAGSACPAVVRASALDAHRRACPFRTVRGCSALFGSF